MSVYDTMAWAKAQRTGSVGRKAVLMALAERTGDEPTCFPSQALLAQETEQSERTVRRCLADLEAAGLIESKRCYTLPDGTRLPRGKARNEYRLKVDQTARLSGRPADQPDTVLSSWSGSPNGQPVPLVDRPTGHGDTTNRTTGADQPDTAVSYEVPSVEPPSLKTPSADGEEALFDAGPSKPQPREDGRAIASEVWETRQARGIPVPTTKFIAVSKMAEKLIDAGHPEHAITEAMVEASTITLASIEFLIGRRKPQPVGALATADQHGASGLVDPKEL